MNDITEIYKRRKCTLKSNHHVKWDVGKKLTSEELDELRKLIQQDYGDNFHLHQARKYIHVEIFSNDYNDYNDDPIDYDDPDWYNEWINDGWN